MSTSKKSASPMKSLQDLGSAFNMPVEPAEPEAFISGVITEEETETKDNVVPLSVKKEPIKVSKPEPKKATPKKAAPSKTTGKKAAPKKTVKPAVKAVVKKPVKPAPPVEEPVEQIAASQPAPIDKIVEQTLNVETVVTQLNDDGGTTVQRIEATETTIQAFANDEEVAAIEPTAASINITEEPAEPLDTDNERENLITQLRGMYQAIDLPYLADNWSVMSNGELKDLLGLLKSDNGGSIEMASLLTQTLRDYELSLHSDRMKTRMRLIEQKAGDHVKMLQTFSKMFGKDVIVAGVKSQDYHQMLKDAVVFITSVTDRINMIAQTLGINFPIEQLMPSSLHVPITEDTPADPRVAIFVLNVLMANLNSLVTQGAYTKEVIAKNNMQIEAQKKKEREQLEIIKDLQKSYDNREDEIRRMLSNGTTWMIKDTRGRILRKIDPDKPLSHPIDLDLNGEMDDALFLTSQRAAITLAERLNNTRRFRNVELRVHKVSVVEIDV